MSIQHQALVKEYKKRITNNGEKINFWGNQIGAKGAKALATLSSTSSLTAIYLWGNKIGNKGAKVLADVLPISSLTKLNLECNDIGAEGAKALATALPTSSLTMLNLWGNRIENKGAKALANVLSISSLTIFSLGNNYIKTEGIQCLKKAISSSHCRIYETDLNGICNLQPRQEKLLAAANRLLSEHRYMTEAYFNQLYNDKKISLFFIIKDTQIKCRNLIMKFFLSKNGDYKNTISALLPVPELLHHILSFVFPVLSGQDISKSWEMAEEKLAAITANTTELKKSLAI